MSLHQLASDLKAAVLFCTRLPIPHAAAITGADLARAGWAFPVAGAIVGLIAAAVYWLAGLAGLPPFPAAGLAVAATLVVTGCLHEDGLADVADAFGGATRERKLEIMRDSRVGTYGACALSMSLLLRTARAREHCRARGGGLGSRCRPHGGPRRHAAVHVAGSSCPVDGLAVGVGRPPAVSALAALLLGVIALLLGAWSGRRRLRDRPAGGRARIAGMALHSADRRPDRRCPWRRRAVRRDFDPAGRGGVPARMMRPKRARRRWQFAPRPSRSWCKETTHEGAPAGEPVGFRQAAAFRRCLPRPSARAARVAP